MENQERKTLIEEKFIAIYGSAPTVWVQAPGRVDLMGSHTDYNLGYVLTQAIDRNTWIAARPRSDGKVRIASFNAAGISEFDLANIEHDILNTWTNYIRGVADVLQKDGYDLTGFDGLIHSTIPFGSGLSSSAALEVATAVLFEALADWEMDAVQKAVLCQKAENEFVGMNCGILDQYSSAMGVADSVVLLDCRAITHEIKPIAPGVQVMICDTKAVRASNAASSPADSSPPSKAASPPFSSSEPPEIGESVEEVGGGRAGGSADVVGRGAACCDGRVGVYWTNTEGGPFFPIFFSDLVPPCVVSSLIGKQVQGRLSSVILRVQP